MNLDLNKIVEKLEKNDLVGNFIKELEKTLENEDKKNKSNNEEIDNIELTSEEEFEYERKEFRFLQEYFEKELLDLSKGEIYIVTNKYENDNEYHRYKVTQYKDNLECKYIAFEKDLPENVKIGDVVRKVNGIYIYDKDATMYLKDALREIKEKIVVSRDKF